jgi:DNA-binding GntR family transcriptional regulator
MPATAEAPLYQTIYDVLRRHLEAGRLPAGLVLGEVNVARAFKASRMPAAAALKRLNDEGWISTFSGRGFIVRGGEAAPVPLRIELAAAGLVLPAALEAEPTPRNLAQRIYPEVEHTVAASLAYGRFQLVESALADHYRVSRTIAHEVLTRLARTGVIVQEANQRWYAGPLTASSIAEHFEMRWILEPVALRQAYPTLSEQQLLARRGRVVRAAEGRRGISEIEEIEKELHVDTVGRCSNSQLLHSLQRSQLLLIATHSTFERHQSVEEITTMLAEHRAIYDLLLSGDVDGAGQGLEAHLRRSLRPNLEIIGRLGPMPAGAEVPYLQPAAGR